MYLHVRRQFEYISVAIFLHMVLCVDVHGFVWVHGHHYRAYVCLWREREGGVDRGREGGEGR